MLNPLQRKFIPMLKDSFPHAEETALPFLPFLTMQHFQSTPPKRVVVLNIGLILICLRVTCNEINPSF